MSFDYPVFKEFFVEKFPEDIFGYDFEELLGFLKDSPKTTGNSKRLQLRKVLFTGTKSLGDITEPFSYEQEFNPGVFMIVANNHRGKSSVFKVVKFALTGDNDLAEDIRNWLGYCYVEFSIGDDVYTSYINLEKHRLKGRLFRSNIKEISEPEQNKYIVFESNSQQDFKDQLQGFFFEQFGFYKLNWTYKAPQKDKNELYTANATWNTYYESIYLRSKTSNILAIGGQEELIFQMLLGLGLTFSINQLKIRIENGRFELNKAREFSTQEQRKKRVEEKNLKKEFDKISKELIRLKQLNNEGPDFSVLYDQYSNIDSSIAGLFLNIRIRENEGDESRRVIRNYELENDEIRYQGKQYREYLAKAEKSKKDLEEHIAFGIFLSNLDIQICPHCSHSIEEEKKVRESHNKKCMLCAHPVSTNMIVDTQVYESKIVSLKKEIDGYSKQIDIHLAKFKKNKEIINAEKEKIKTTEASQKNDRLSIKQQSRHLKDLESKLAQARERSGAESRIVDLERQQAVLDFRLQSYLQVVSDSTQIDIEIKERNLNLLQHAIA